MTVIDTVFPSVMTKQEVFTYVVNFLLKQGVRSANSNGECLYRGPNNTACAVGCLIRDDEYTEAMDRNDEEIEEGTTDDEYTEAMDVRPSGPTVVGTGVKQINERDLLPKRLSPHVEFLFELQFIHDRRFPEEWLGAFRRLASNHNLSMENIRT